MKSFRTLKKNQQEQKKVCEELLKFFNTISFKVSKHSTLKSKLDQAYNSFYSINSLSAWSHKKVSIYRILIL